MTFFFATARHFKGLVANLILQIFIEFIELFLVRVFLEGYLMVIGDRAFLKDQNDTNVAMVTCNVFLREGFLFEAFRAMATFYCKL